MARFLNLGDTRGNRGGTHNKPGDHTARAKPGARMDDYCNAKTASHASLHNQPFFFYWRAR